MIKGLKTKKLFMSNIQNVADISIVIPTYNRCELLKRAINSVLDQTINVREIIIVDNGSTDKTNKNIIFFISYPCKSVTCKHTQTKEKCYRIWSLFRYKHLNQSSLFQR